MILSIHRQRNITPEYFLLSSHPKKGLAGLMQIRPFFWIILAVSVICIILFAIIYQPHTPVTLEVHMGQAGLNAREPAQLEITLTDPHGLPIDQAQVRPSAWMTNMTMAAQETNVQPLGDGRYTVDLDLNMAGPWAIHIQANAYGFATQQRTLYVDVT